MGGACSSYGAEERCVQNLGEGRRSLGRPRLIWDLQEVGWGVRTGLIWLGIGSGGGHL